MEKLYRTFCKYEEIVAIACLTASVVIILVASLARVLRNPIAGALDVALLAFAWSAFLGADVAYRKGNLVNVNLWENHVSAKTKRVVEVFVYLLIAAFLIALVVFGAIQSIKTWERAFQGLPSISYTWVTLSVPVSAALMLVTTAIKIRSLVLGKEEAAR